MEKNTAFRWLVLAIFFLSCNQVERQDLTGHWEFFPIVGVEENQAIPQVMNFSGENATLIDDYLFQQAGTFEFEGKRLKISLEGGQQLELEIRKFEKDTLETASGSVFLRIWNISEFDFEEYQLIGISAGEGLNANVLFTVIHFYKNAENEVKIRAGETFIEYSDLPLFLERTPALAVFVGQGIGLTDLKELYFSLAAVGKIRVTLVLNQAEYGRYQVFRDWIEIWWDDVESHFVKDKWMLPPPPPPEIRITSRKEYLTQGVEVIEINEPEDLGKISGLKNDKKYLVSISENLSLEDYIKLKKRVFEMREEQNLEVKTEIL